jgi:hypothetical protein
MKTASDQKPRVDEHRTFNRALFFKRAWAAPAIGIIWLAESMSKHDSTGVVLAIVIGFVVGPAIAYIWTLRSP